MFNEYVSPVLYNHIEKEQLSAEQSKFLTDLLPLFQSEDRESILLGIGYLEQEKWNRNITADRNPFGYTTRDLIYRIKYGISDCKLILEIIISTIIKNNVYYVHSYQDNG